MYAKTILMLAATTVLIGCGVGQQDWWMGTDEPVYPEGKADDPVPLTIYLSKGQTDVRTVLGEDRLGELRRERTGYVYIDGKSLTSDTVVIFAGQLHRYDGKVDDQLLVVHPRYISREEGSANPDGMLRVDFGRQDRMRSFLDGVDPLGTHAGVFRGDIIATDAFALEGNLADDLTTYYIRPRRFNQRPPNLLRDVAIYFPATAVLTRLVPSAGSEDPCLGDMVVDTTLSGTKLDVEVSVEGFPAGRPVTVEVRYLIPHYAAHTIAGHLWDYVSDLWSGEFDEVTRTVVIEDPDNDPSVRLPVLKTPGCPWGSDMYRMDIEVSAYVRNDSAMYAWTYVHQLNVVRDEEEVVVDQFELCPTDDAACHETRDQYAAENVVSRRNVIEWKASEQGLYNSVRRPLGKCMGGGTVSGNYATACNVYRESRDDVLAHSLETELSFELSVNGQLHGSASWSKSYNGIPAADIEVAFQATFGLEADLQARFETTHVWKHRHTKYSRKLSHLDVIYDPADTQIQWWRVVTPRMRYLEIARFTTCGARNKSTEVFLSDLRESRLVLACEQVPSFDTVCHAVEPNTETVEACNTLLIDPESEQGEECLTEDENLPDE